MMSFALLAFLCFLVSGFCGLLYQVLWLRLALASFGVITPVISVVVSVFMAGLWAGTWAAGRWGARLADTLGVPPLALYGAAELFIGLGAFLVPRLFHAGEMILSSAGALDSGSYLLRSGLVLAAALLPWCAAMGATVPLMLEQGRREGADASGFSLLYTANVLGALLGVALTAILLIEWLGLRGTLHLGAACNVGLGLAACSLAWRRPERTGPRAGDAGAGTGALPVLILFSTGFCAMGMEVVWTRLLTPILSTQVYAFALVLFTYLLGTLFGSLRYRRDAARGRGQSTPRLLAFAAAGSILPLALNDPRLHDSAFYLGAFFTALLSLLPFCAALGYLTPGLIDRAAGGDPRLTAQAYAWNILGCVLGPLVVSYLLLPSVGTGTALLVLTAPLTALAVRALPARRRLLPALAGLALLAVPAVLCWTYEEPREYGPGALLRRDSTATVIAAGEGPGSLLLVNGIGITGLTPLTKVMAHLPSAALGRPPQKALVICFGMGTTFRSLSSWGMDVTGVELVPSVPSLMGYYHADAQAVLTRPRSHVVIDDGRRFLRRSRESFDVITLDPPPPIEAAASSLLYSEEFYALAKSRLAEDGILQQWVPTESGPVPTAMARALRAQFPFVRMYRSYDRYGFHFLASRRPLAGLDAAKLEAAMPAAARADMMEWFHRGAPHNVFQAILAGEVDVDQLLAAGGPSLTDDRPYNEYYLMRRLAPGRFGGPAGASAAPPVQ
jgi:predicted membrane-bound spermidine synthase